MVVMKYIASCSFGKDSLAMVLRLLKEDYPLDEVVYFDIGVEFDSIKNNAERMKTVLAERGIKFTILKPKPEFKMETVGVEKRVIEIEGDKVFLYRMLTKPVQKRNGKMQCGYKWCGGCARWGTTLKLDAIEEHNKTYGDEVVVEYVGVAADERHRINRQRSKNRVKLYPLVEWDMKEADCLEYCYSLGWHWYENGYELYDLLDRVSCKYCRNKNLDELRNIYHHLPEVWEELKDLQDKVGMPYRDGKTIHDIETRFITEDAQLDLFDESIGAHL